jgi:hypothetical protein
MTAQPRCCHEHGGRCPKPRPQGAAGDLGRNEAPLGIGRDGAADGADQRLRERHKIAGPHHDGMGGLRPSPKKRREIEAGAAAQPGKPSFSEAVRRLIDLGLPSGTEDDGVGHTGRGVARRPARKKKGAGVKRPRRRMASRRD